MEYSEIKKLIDSMGDSKLTDLDISFADGTKISMKKDSHSLSTINNSEIVLHANEILGKSDVNSGDENEKQSKVIKSPMVGTFYTKPNPNADMFVNEGDIVEVGQTLCIIEAMKLMNEIESEYSGRIKRILVKDGEMVEYGQPLVEIE